MPKFSFENCARQVPSRFELVVIASKRAQQIIRGSRPRVEEHHNPARTALREISAGKILKNGESRSYHVSPAEPPAPAVTADPESEAAGEEPAAGAA
ncbi:MAG: DNA-directed RNA polymerase subunit omega [Acidobacteria bacterium]|nr:DNA-directed RNA polymerase subunit omega [Acidobacteriota bacterium]